DRPVPSDDIEGMVIEHVPAHVVRPLEPDLGRTFPVGLERVGTVKVALAEWRELRELPVARAVAVRHVDQTGHLDAQHASAGDVVEVDAVDRAAGDDDVVVPLEGEVTELAVQRTAPLVHEEHLVRGAVDVEHLLRVHRRDQTDVHVVVDQEPAPPGDDVALGGQVESLEVRVGMHLLVFGGHEVRGTFADVLRAFRHVAVVDERRRATEALASEQLFVRQPTAIREAHVALAGHVPELLVRSHAQSLAVQPCASAPTTSKIASSSTAAPRGSCATPTALRACRPRSVPSTETRRSDAPLMTSGCPVNVGALCTKPVSLTTATVSSVPSAARAVPRRS